MLDHLEGVKGFLKILNLLLLIESKQCFMFASDKLGIWVYKYPIQ